MSTANVVDSSGWLEYFTDNGRASLFATAIEDAGNYLVPVISIYEVFEKVLRECGEDDATPSRQHHARRPSDRLGRCAGIGGGASSAAAAAAAGRQPHLPNPNLNPPMIAKFWGKVDNLTLYHKISHRFQVN